MLGSSTYIFIQIHQISTIWLISLCFYFYTRLNFDGPDTSYSYSTFFYRFDCYWCLPIGLILIRIFSFVYSFLLMQSTDKVKYCIYPYIYQRKKKKKEKPLPPPNFNLYCSNSIASNFQIELPVSTCFKQLAKKNHREHQLIVNIGPACIVLNLNLRCELAEIHISHSDNIGYILDLCNSL